MTKFIASGFISLLIVAFAVWLVMSANFIIIVVYEYIRNWRSFTEVAVMIPGMSVKRFCGFSCSTLNFFNIALTNVCITIYVCQTT
jgi:hypothetical protein